MLRKSISLTEVLNEWVRAQVESGKYANDSEVIREALRYFMAQEEIEKRQDMLEEAYFGQRDSRSTEEIFANSRARLAKKSK